MNGKRLYRSESNRMLCGVCAGIAEYFNLDPTLIRLAWALFCVLGGSGVLGAVCMACVALLCFLPLLLDGKEALTWRRLRSNI